jgi:hypothetical protein
MSGYTKLFASLIHSTVWREPDYVRLVWITMLAMADRDGIVEAAIPGLADAARVDLDKCLDALERLKAADPYSRTKDHEGRRIEDIDGGWRILNHAQYRQRLTLDQYRQKHAERQRRYREKKKLAEPVANAEPPSDFNGSQDETVIPLDLATRAEKILPEMLEGMRGVTIDQLRDGVREFISYWTIGGGKFKKRNFWMKRLREDLRKKYEQNKFRAPGAIEHAERTGSDEKKLAPRKLSSGAEKLIAMAKDEERRRGRKVAAE